MHIHQGCPVKLQGRVTLCHLMVQSLEQKQYGMKVITAGLIFTRNAVLLEVYRKM